MITVKFPALNKALSKDLKDLNEDDPKRGVIVIDNNAIVLRNNFCLICNLYDYFTIECGVDDDSEIEELQRIMFYMEEKMFSNEYWAELTKGANMEIQEGHLFIENPKYSKDLYYKEVPVNLTGLMVQLEKICGQKVDTVPSIAIPFGALNTIYSCLSSEFKNDKIIFEFFSQDKPVKFTFKDRKHFYGFIMPDYDAAQEGFKFDTFETFIRETQELIDDLKEQAKLESAAPPPPTSQDIANEMVQVANDEEDENDAQLKIVVD